MASRKYVTQPAESSSCPTCGAHPTLLMREDGRAPAFYLCACGFVGQVGVGPVRYGTAPTKAERVAQGRWLSFEQDGWPDGAGGQVWVWYPNLAHPQGGNMRVQWTPVQAEHAVEPTHWTPVMYPEHGPSGNPCPTKTERIEQARLRALEHYVERLALCPDHRDKATGRCIVCQAEERGRREARDD